MRMPLPLAALVLLWAAPAAADRTVYKSVDAYGHVTYSDRRARPEDTRVKNWMPANPGRYAYDAAVLRAESDRLYYARLRAERRQPVPVAVYDPRRWQSAPARALYPAWGGRFGGWDPNLPLSPAPSLDRTYYYDGR